MPDRGGGNTQLRGFRFVPGATIVVAMPIYEFRCASCDARFEGLVPAGTESIPCTECASTETVRVLSAPGAPPRLVKSRGSVRKQERQNAKLHADTKARFKAARKKARDAKHRGSGGD